MKATLAALALSAAALAVPAAPALAADMANAPRAVRGDRPQPLPAMLNDAERAQYRAVFRSLSAQDWLGAGQQLDAMRPGPLHDLARAMLYTAPGSPRVELPQLMAALEAAPELPQAAALARLATSRGATSLPRVPEAQRLVGRAGQPRRTRARATRGEPLAAELDPQVQAMIVAANPYGAESVVIPRAAELSPEALTEFQQRIAWSHYLTGNDRAARQLADRARQGRGDWVIHAEWVAGLAAWRMDDCDGAAEAFGNVGSRASDPELMAAGQYWAARADMRCGRPERVQARLRTAARLGETFYGLLATSALGLEPRIADNAGRFTQADWRALSGHANVRAAIALGEIGETALAEELLRHQARIGRPDEHEALLHLAERMALPATQMWLAHNAPRGVDVDPLARYPRPDWQPERGWRVDQALVYALALQESGFRPAAVSPAGARGLMQIMPAAASDIGRQRGRSFSPAEINDPVTNIELGQSYLEFLRDFRSTDGLLPKVLAAYNAGPAPIAEWNVRGFDGGDPLLYIESIPYWETRGYVPIVLRNYWVYETRAGQQSASRHALAQGMWPRFPGMSGASAVRIDRPRQAVYGQAETVSAPAGSP